tara:strand:+ start:30688 stop:31395 length:708 start_codon:yes stop_codon:yes gene_type:complete
MIIVMGCYRTGTSAVAGILHHLGVNMGSNFQEPNEANPKGYFEDPDFLEANREVHEANQAMQKMSGTDVRCVEAERRINKATKKWRELVCQKYGPSGLNSALWGFKDPKFCLVASSVMYGPLTTDGISFRKAAKIIWIHRDVDETVMSIIKSLGLHGLDADPNKWRAFVNHYVNRTINYMACHEGPSLDINLPGLLTNPRVVINQIAGFVGVWDKSKLEQAYRFMECSNFIYTDP